MNKFLKTHIDAVKNRMSRGPISDDFGYSDLLIGHTCKLYRNVLMRQKADKYQSISKFSFQTLCVKLQKASLAECPGMELPEECLLLRSVTKIPEILYAGKRMLGSVHFADGKILSNVGLGAESYSRFKENKVNLATFFILDGYLFISTKNKQLKKLFITAVFEDPEVVASVDGDTLSLVGNAKEDFTIDAELVPIMYQMVIKDLVSTYQILPRDDENNARDVEVIQPDSIN